MIKKTILCALMVSLVMPAHAMKENQNKVPLSVAIPVALLVWGGVSLGIKKMQPKLLSKEQCEELAHLRTSYEKCMQKNKTEDKCKFEKEIYTEKEYQAKEQLLATLNSNINNQEKFNVYNEFYQATGNNLNKELASPFLRIFIDYDNEYSFQNKVLKRKYPSSLKIFTEQTLDAGKDGWIYSGNCDTEFLGKLLDAFPTDIRENVDARKLLKERASEPCAGLVQKLFDTYMQKYQNAEQGKNA